MPGGNRAIKYYCPAPCDHTAKRRVSQGHPVCPHCRQPMINMGDAWRPGRRGTRTRTWDTRQEGWRFPTPGLSYPDPRPDNPMSRKRVRALAEAGQPVPQHGVSWRWPWHGPQRTGRPGRRPPALREPPFGR